jgi:IS5 family transposase
VIRIRDIERKTQGNGAQPTSFARLLQVTRRIHSQPRKRAEGDPPKLYSVHAPEVECIAKGKAHKHYEFGVKVGIVSTSRESFVIGTKSLPGTTYARSSRSCGFFAPNWPSRFRSSSVRHVNKPLHSS